MYPELGSQASSSRFPLPELLHYKWWGQTRLYRMQIFVYKLRNEGDLVGNGGGLRAGIIIMRRMSALSSLGDRVVLNASLICTKDRRGLARER